jgi:hypothetical protein
MGSGSDAVTFLSEPPSNVPSIAKPRSARAGPFLLQRLQALQSCKAESLSPHQLWVLGGSTDTPGRARHRSGSGGRGDALHVSVSERPGSHPLKR